MLALSSLRRLARPSWERFSLRERVPDIDYVDLRFDQRMYVRSVTVRHKQP